MSAWIPRQSCRGRSAFFSCPDAWARKKASVHPLGASLYTRISRGGRRTPFLLSLVPTALPWCPGMSQGQAEGASIFYRHGVHPSHDTYSTHYDIITRVASRTPPTSASRLNTLQQDMHSRLVVSLRTERPVPRLSPLARPYPQVFRMVRSKRAYRPGFLRMSSLTPALLSSCHAFQIQRGSSILRVCRLAHPCSQDCSG